MFVIWKPALFSARTRLSDYATQLREKQKLRRIYGVLEKQFKLYFSKAERARGNTGDALLSLLERRLDNAVWKLGFAPSHKAARQSIVHGHITVNGGRPFLLRNDLAATGGWLALDLKRGDGRAL